MINSLEQKILNSLTLGENRLYVTEWHKQIGCCRPVIYKYLKILANKGYIKPHHKEAIRGRTSGEKTWITIIEKIKA